MKKSSVTLGKMLQVSTNIHSNEFNKRRKLMNPILMDNWIYRYTHPFMQSPNLFIDYLQQFDSPKGDRPILNLNFKRENRIEKVRNMIDKNGLRSIAATPINNKFSTSFSNKASIDVHSIELSSDITNKNKGENGALTSRINFNFSNNSFDNAKIKENFSRKKTSRNSLRDTERNETNRNLNKKKKPIFDFSPSKIKSITSLNNNGQSFSYTFSEDNYSSESQEDESY